MASGGRCQTVPLLAALKRRMSGFTTTEVADTAAMLFVEEEWSNKTSVRTRAMFKGSVPMKQMAINVDGATDRVWS
jgi:hypothetical protein